MSYGTIFLVDKRRGKTDRTMKKQWLYYFIAGIVFGIFDFYFQIWINQLSRAGILNTFVMLIPIYGIWLVMVAPIALNEAKKSHSVWLAAAASAFSWSVSIVAYYLFMGVKLIFIGEPSRPEMHISSRSDPYYWENIKSFFANDVVNHISEWIVIALVGGTLVGLAIGFLVVHAQKNRQRMA